MGNKFQEIKNKINKLRDENRFEEAIELIETIPEDERDLELCIYHAQMFNNIAMITLGEYDEDSSLYKQNDEDDENSPKVLYIQKAIALLEDIKDEGKEDRFWNYRMAMAYYSMGHVLINQSFHYYSLALPYFKKFYKLEKKTKKKEALEMLDECIEHLADRYLTQKKYLEGFSMIDSLSEGWNGYYPCFDISGIKEQEEKEIDDILSSQLDDLAEKGNLFLEQGNMEEALKVWQSAIDMIPEPKSMQAETVWFESSMADIYFMKKAFNEAQLLFERALCNLSGQGVNSFIFMRRGECQYELGNKKFAKHFLLQAYMLEGEEIFKSEEQNIKYLEFLLKEMKKDQEARNHSFKDFDFTDLDSINWIFDKHKYSKEEFTKKFNEIMIEQHGIKWWDTNVNAMLEEPEILVTYEAWIESISQLYENERLNEQDELLEEYKEDGMWQVEIMAYLKADNGKFFTFDEILFKLQNLMSNKELGDHVFFEGIDYEGHECEGNGLIENEDGIPVFYVACGS